MKRSTAAALGFVLLSASASACGGAPEPVCIGECEVPATETDVAASTTGSTGTPPAPGTTTGPEPESTDDPPPASESGPPPDDTTGGSSTGLDGTSSGSSSEGSSGSSSGPGETTTGDTGA